MRPIVLSIAGSDPSGGAGIQADTKTVEACGGYAASAITAITVQNTRGVRRWESLPADLVRAQVDAVLDDLEVRAVKTGMLGDRDVVESVAVALTGRRPPIYVLDPIVAASDGSTLLSADALDGVVALLLPLATVVTPNADEARVLTGIEVRDLDSAERAGRALVDRGARAALIKGGHLTTLRATDLLVTPDGVETFHAERIDTPHTHGTGCVLSAALATALGRGRSPIEAVAEAKRFVTDAIRAGLSIGGGRGPVDPMFARHAGAAEVG